MKIEKILLLSKGSVLDSSNNVLVSGHRLRMYKEIDELITSSSAVEGLGRARRRARWRATGTRGGGRTRKKTAAVSWKANGRRREEEEGGGVRRGRRGADRSAPGAGGYIPERITPGASHQPGVKGFLAGHETAAHLYSRVGFPPGSKGDLQFRFPPVLSNRLVKYSRNAIVFVKYVVN